MEFRKLTDDEQKELGEALRGNAERARPLYMDPRDTQYRLTPGDPHDDEVIASIKSIPCHYS